MFRYLFIAACMWLVPGVTFAAPRALDVEQWLVRPGVRAVAVEFYATWCEPCMKALPRWQALRDKFGPEGLRVIVVNTRDGANNCVPPKWQPDLFVCDLEGTIADRFGVQDLPSALLWSWQGNLLVKSGHIGEVERETEKVIGAAPRVLLQPGARVEAETLVLLRELLTDSGKVTVVASDEERAALQAAKLKAQGAHYDGDRKCELGKELAPNSQLKVDLIDGRGEQLISLALLDLEKGCQTQAATARWNPARPREGLRDAVENLLGKLRRPDVEQLSVSRNATSRGDQSGTIAVTSDVEGADVFVDGHLAGDQAGARSISVDASAGPHEVKVTKTGYLEHLERVTVVSGRRTAVEAKLVAEATARQSFVGDVSTTLFVKSDPPGALLVLDGRPLGRAGEEFDIAPGHHTLRARLEMHLDTESAFDVAAGDVRKFELKLTPTYGSIEVTGKTPGMAVALDGRPVGTASPMLKIPRVAEGEHALRFSAPDVHDETRSVVVVSAQATKLIVPALKTAVGGARIESAPAGASCEVDGMPLGATPVTARKLSSGVHEVRLTLPRHETLVRTITVRDGQTSTERFVLEPAFGTVEVRASQPGAAVYVDGQRQGTAPLTLELDEGPYAVEVRADERAYQPWKGKVVAVRKKSTLVDAKLEPIYGRLLVKSSPPEAKVMIDDKPRGETPLAVDRILGGPHRLRLSLDGHRDAVQTLVIEGNRENKVQVKLRPGMEEVVELPNAATALVVKASHSGRNWAIGASLASLAGFAHTGLHFKWASDARNAAQARYSAATQNVARDRDELAAAVDAQRQWRNGSVLTSAFAVAFAGLAWWLDSNGEAK